jgi:hypothetical protein
MTPNTRKHPQLPHSLPHTLDLNLRILWRKIQIRLRRQHQRLRFNSPHCLSKIAAIRLLIRTIRRLPRMRHAQHILRIFAQRPLLPEIHHEVLQVLVSQRRLEQFLAVKRLAEAPARVHAAQRFEASFARRARERGTRRERGRRERRRATYPCGRCPDRGVQRGLDAFEKDLVVQRGFCGPAEGRDQVHEVGVLGRPLVRLAGAHGPSQDGARVRDAQVFGYEGVLGADVVVEEDVGEGA